MTDRAQRSALVITASDGAAAGVREDTSGARVEDRLTALGFSVDRRLLPDEQWEIEAALVEGTDGHDLIVTTGGTGLTPRDVTPQATQAVIDYEVPGLAEAMRAVGRAATPLADLSRAVVGVRGRTPHRQPARQPEGRRSNRSTRSCPCWITLSTPSRDRTITRSRPTEARRREASPMFAPFAEVPGYPLVFIVFWGAAAFFCLAMARHLRVFAVARPSRPFAQIPVRVVSLVEYAFLQTKMFKDPGAATMHAGIFWGFVLLTIGTANIVTGGVIQGVLSIPFDGLLWTLVSAMQNVVAVAVLGSIGWAFYRRLISKPRRLTFNRDALIILSMIGGVVATELFAQVFDVAAHGDIPGAFVSNAFAKPLTNLSPEVLDAGFAILWWGHIALVAAFLCYLPFSKHLHIATAFPNIFFRKLAPRGELPKLDLEDENATFGLKTLQDLGWKDLLDGFTCTECGRCQEACPAYNTGKPLNPKELIMGIRHMSVEAEHGIDIIPNSPIVRDTYGLDDTTVSPKLMAKPIVDDAISYDAVWDCVTCGACVEACPVLIEHVDKIVGLRRNLVLEESRFPSELTTAFRSMENQGNPWGQPASSRLDWTKPLPFEVPTVAEMAAEGRLGELDVLYWVGCAAAFDTRNQKVARAVATCLHAAGVRFAILGQEESCTGDPGTADGQRLRLPDAGDGQCRDARPVRHGAAHDRDRLSALLQHDRQRIRPAGWELLDRPSLDVPRRVGVVRAARDGAGRRRERDRGPPAGQRHGPRLVLSRPLQQRHRRATGRAGRGGRVHHRDGEVGQEHLLLRGGWRPHVDGGDTWHADQREPHRPGPGYRCGDGRDVVPVLHGHDVGRSGGRTGRDRGERHGHQRGPGRTYRVGPGRAPAARPLGRFRCSVGRSSGRAARRRRSRGPR